jgi:Family of unknown function (DUF6527)
MSRVEKLEHRYVEFVPKEVDEGVLYISNRFRTATHLCCCGCGQRVVTPLNPAKWRLTDHGDSVSLSPSIGNGAFECRSHYWIRRGHIDWYPPMTDWQTDRARQRDEYDSQVYTGERPAVPRRAGEVDPSVAPWWKRFLRWLGFR